MTPTVATLRADEARYRALGKYELAVQYQRQADLVEAGGDPFVGIYAVLDRGAIEPLKYGHVGHLTAFELPSGLAWCLTPDQLFKLWTVLTDELALTPHELINVALYLVERQAAKAVMPEAANHYWQEGWEANEDGEHRNPYRDLAAAAVKARGGQ